MNRNVDDLTSSVGVVLYFSSSLEYGDDRLYVIGKVQWPQAQFFFLWNNDKFDREIYASAVVLITKDTSSMVENRSTAKVNRTESIVKYNPWSQKLKSPSLQFKP